MEDDELLIVGLTETRFRFWGIKLNERGENEQDTCTLLWHSEYPRLTKSQQKLIPRELLTAMTEVTKVLFLWGQPTDDAFVLTSHRQEHRVVLPISNTDEDIPSYALYRYRNR